MAVKPLPIVTRPFLARIGGEFGAGVIDTIEYQKSVEDSASFSSPHIDGDLAINGLHGLPLRAVPEEGQREASISGDLGAATTESGGATFGVGDVGIAYGLGNGGAVGVTFGGKFSKSDLVNGGSANERGFYVMPEAVMNLGGPVFATADFYYGRGSMEINRAYMNGGSVAINSGSPDVETIGGRFRLDWQNAATVNGTNVTPYASFTHLTATTDAYTETGSGPFPAAWAENTERLNILRIGVDTDMPLSETVTLLGKLEYGHRFEATSGAQSVGLVGSAVPFSVAGAANRQDWARIGIGAEAKLGTGTASVMVNATTDGKTTGGWLNASYRLNF